MQTYKLTCDMGHDEMSWTTQADSMDDAADKFLAMQELKDHVAEMHPEWAGKSDEEMKQAVMDMITEGGDDMDGDDMDTEESDDMGGDTSGDSAM